jgi:hypothetical protein
MHPYLSASAKMQNFCFGISPIKMTCIKQRLSNSGQRHSLKASHQYSPHPRWIRKLNVGSKPSQAILRGTSFPMPRLTRGGPLHVLVFLNFSCLPEMLHAVSQLFDKTGLRLGDAHLHISKAGHS